MTANPRPIRQFFGPTFRDFDDRTGVRAARMAHLRYFEGDGGGDGGGGGGNPDPNPSPAPSPAPATPPAPPAPAPAPAPTTEPPTGDVASLPEWAQGIITSARTEAARYRTERNESRTLQEQQADQIAAINKALGITTEAPSPEELQQKLSERETELRTLKVENAFSRAADVHAADKELTLAVLSRNGVLAGLNPEDVDFASQLDAAVKTAVEANPKLKVTQVAQTSGSPGFTGNNGGGRSDAPVDLTSAIAQAIS